MGVRTLELVPPPSGHHDTAAAQRSAGALHPSQRTKVGLSRGQRGTRRWHGGLADCCTDFSTCCLVYWCPWAVFGGNARRIGSTTLEVRETTL